MHQNTEDHVKKNLKNNTCNNCDFVCEKEFDLKLHISVKHASILAEFKVSKSTDMKRNLLTKMTYSKEY